MNLFGQYIKLVFVILVFLFSNVFVHSRNDKHEKGDKSVFTNQLQLDSFFEKLYQLESTKKGKINIVHIGDSHVQADFLTNIIRKSLQDKFGDAGYGFTFPFKLAKTNGTNLVRYASDAEWNSRLNVSPISADVNIGLSGIGLYTTDANCAVEITTIEEPFNSIKAFYSTKSPQFMFSLPGEVPNKIKLTEQPTEIRNNKHVIKSGETLSMISVRYKTTIEALKKENNLKSDHIEAGATLKIPIRVEKAKEEELESDTASVSLQETPYYTSYTSPVRLNKINLLPIKNNNLKSHDISGFIIENNNPGLIYHAVGVNGAKISDFNKYPLFFEQLNVMEADLIILSFGTNESFQKLPVDSFIRNLNNMVEKIRKGNPDVAILVMAPPPSLMRRKNSNKLVEQYAKALTNLKDYPTWDLYTYMGGEKGIREGGKYVKMIAKDKIHYTIKGYRTQGDWFVNDFMKAYNNYKQRRGNN